MKILLSILVLVPVLALASTPRNIFLCMKGDVIVGAADKAVRDCTVEVREDDPVWQSFVKKTGDYKPTPAQIDAQFKRRVCDANPELIAAIGLLASPAKTPDEMCDLMKSLRK